MSTSNRVNQRLVKRLKGLLANMPVDVIGHVESAFACCDNGTVALVKLDAGRPARKASKPKRKSSK